MKITIAGDSQNITFNKLRKMCRKFTKSEKIKVKINGVKWKGFIETIEYKEHKFRTVKIIKLSVIEC